MGRKYFSYMRNPSLLIVHLFLPFVTPLPYGQDSGYNPVFTPGYDKPGYDHPGFRYDSPLDYRFYDQSCPRLQMIVRSGLWTAFRDDSRIAASLLRLHFHDCFVNGCDASILLEDTEDFRGEKNAFPNRNSIRGYEVIESIKAEVEKSCPLTVSCADIVALAAREATVLSGGPFWPVELGRRDSLTASEEAAVKSLPAPFEPLENITAKFETVGLNFKDVVVLSGAHTIGFSRCFSFKNRLFDFKNSGQPDPNLASSLLTELQGMCPNLDSSNAYLAPLDAVSSDKFDNAYYTNLVKNTGLLESDQALMSDPKSANLVKSYSENPYLFNGDFAVSMIKMGQFGVLTGHEGEIRKKCGAVNGI